MALEVVELVKFGYDGNGNLAQVVNSSALPQQFTYDGQHRITTWTDRNNHRYRYLYDRAGRCVQTRGDGGFVDAVFAYDTEPRITRVTNALGSTTVYHLNELGQTVTEVDALGSQSTFSWDRYDRLIASTDPLGRTNELFYDADGNLSHTRRPDGSASSAAYNDFHQVVEAVLPDGTRWGYGYDERGNLTELVDPNGVTLRYTRNSLGHVVAVADSLGHTSHIQPDAAGLPVAITDPTGALTRCVRDGFGRPVTITAQGDRTMALDPAGRITALTGRNWTETYAYDRDGSLTRADWSAPEGHPATAATGEREYTGTLLRRAGRTHYEYDGQGRVVRQTRKLLSGGTGTWHYTWDADDRLTRLTTPDGVTWRYLYDPLGRRIAKQRLSDDLRTVLEETTFTWDGAVLAEQTRTTADTDTARTTTWEWDPDTYRPLAQSERVTSLRDAPQDDIDARFYAIVTDLVGTPTELVDDSGAIAWQHRTTVWGVPLDAPESPTDCPLAFPGQYRDHESGLHYNLFRYYEPLTGRYLSPDPLGLDPAPDPHSYVHNPQTWADPLGLAPCMQGLENMASKIAKVLSPRQQEGQTVAAIHVQTPHGPRIFVAGTSKSKLTPAQRKLAEEMGAIPLPNDQYIKVKPGEKGGHAEQNLLLFFNRMHTANGGSSWNPTHGGASRSVCSDFCAPFIRNAGGKIHGPVHQKEGGTKQRQFFWPGMI